MNIDLSTIQDAQKENPSAQTKIFNAFFTALTMKGAREFGLREEAEDVAIVALTKAFKAMRETVFASPGEFVNWTFRIHRNSAYDLGRKKLRSTRAVTIEEPLWNTAQVVDTFDQSTNLNTRERLRTTLEILDEHENCELLLLYASGYRDTVLAKRFKLPVGTVKSKIRRTRAWLAQKANS
ncbi:MAG: polymerase sigma-70 factor, subfamily [Patescibacteria group bacterium]|jgi:RNA polymerase sigma-70 factor (ECF subfamily)|nr:polymerase sigma-70 factor, subfamily [Patescibacteria group bacterium]